MKSVFKVSLAALTGFCGFFHAANKTRLSPPIRRSSRSNLSKAISMWVLTLTCGRLSPRAEARLHPEANGLQRHYPGAANQKYRSGAGGITVPTSVKSDRLLRRLLQSGLLVMVNANNDIKDVKI